MGELPFKYVEHENLYFAYANAFKLTLSSLHKISPDVGMYYIDVGKYYIEEKMLAYLSNPNKSINLTMNTETFLCQIINYTVVTGHQGFK